MNFAPRIVVTNFKRGPDYVFFILEQLERVIEEGSDFRGGAHVDCPARHPAVRPTSTAVERIWHI